MYYEEEQYFEPSEFEDKINELISNEVKERVGTFCHTLKTLQADNIEQSKIISDLRSKLRRFEQQKSDELKQALKEKELEVNRKFGLGFAINDEVYVADRTTTSTKCEKCGGSGKVTVEILGKTVNVSCPHCSYGKIITYNYFPEKTLIKSMKFHVTREDSWNKKSIGVVKDNDVEIWLDNGGYSYNINSLYKTLEECQATCDEKNKKEIEENVS